MVASTTLSDRKWRALSLSKCPLALAYVALKKSLTQRHGDTEEEKKLFLSAALCEGIEKEPHTEARRHRDTIPLCVRIR
jgi:hypothetical protein